MPGRSARPEGLMQSRMTCSRGLLGIETHAWFAQAAVRELKEHDNMDLQYAWIM